MDCRISLALALLLILLSPKVNSCQDLSDSKSQTAPAEKPPIFSDITIWGAQTVGSTVLMSEYEGQRMAALGVGLRRHFHTYRHLDMHWNFEIVPLCVPSFPTPGGRTYHFGGGGSVGVEFEPRKEWKVQPYFDVGGGLLMFTEPTPIPQAKRLNFLLQFGPGVQVPLKGRSSLRLGMWYSHFSDGHSTRDNPGFDGYLLYAAYTFSFGER